MKNALKDLRKAQNWSQQDLAEQLGISRQSVIAIEKEKYDPSLDLAFKIARLFDTSIEALFFPDA
jgi:putative transcriptional regulator